MLICLFQKTVRGRLSVISKKGGILFTPHKKINTPKISLLLFFPMFVLLERFVEN